MEENQISWPRGAARVCGAGAALGVPVYFSPGELGGQRVGLRRGKGVQGLRVLGESRRRLSRDRRRAPGCATLTGVQTATGMAMVIWVCKSMQMPAGIALFMGRQTAVGIAMLTGVQMFAGIAKLIGGQTFRGTAMLMGMQTCPGASLLFPEPRLCVSLLPPADTDNISGCGQGWSTCSCVPPQCLITADHHIQLRCTVVVLEGSAGCPYIKKKPQNITLGAIG